MLCIMIGISRVDRENLFIWDVGVTKGHKKLKKTRCKKDTKEFSFPYRCMNKYVESPW